MLTVEQIRAADDLKIERVGVPEWAPPDTDPKDSVVYVRSMTAGERDSFIGKCIDANTGKVNPHIPNVTAILLSLCVCDEHGKVIAPGAAGVALFASKSAKACNAPFERAMAINAISDKDIEDLEGN